MYKKKRFIIISSIISAVLVLALVLTLSLTLTGNIKLDAPNNLHIENNTVIWNSVENASGYILAIDDLTYDLKQSNFNFDEYNFASGSYKLKVKTKGNGKKYLNSNFSNEIIFEYINTSKYRLNVLSSDGGSTSIINSSSEYDADSLVQVVAHPNEGWYFDGWFSENFYKLSSELNFSFTINTNTILRAQFLPNSSKIGANAYDDTEFIGNDKNFAVYVYCTEDIDYIRKNFHIYDSYYLDRENNVIAGCEDEAIVPIGGIENRGDNRYVIHPVNEGYEPSGAYVAKARGAVVILKEQTRFANNNIGNALSAAESLNEEGADELAFSITNTKHAKIKLNKDVFVYSYLDNVYATKDNIDGTVIELIGSGHTQDENTLGGFITRSIKVMRNGIWSELQGCDGEIDGDLIGFGGGLTKNRRIILSDGSAYDGLTLEQFNENTILGMIKKIHTLGDVNYPVYFVELVAVDDEEMFFEELDIYSDDEIQIGDVIDENDEELISAIEKNFYQNEEFQKFLAGVDAASEKYSKESGVSNYATTASSFLDKIKLKPNLKIEGTTLILSIKGNIDLDFNKRLDKIDNSGSIKISFELEEKLTYSIRFAWIKGKWGIKKGFDIALVQDEETRFTFDVKAMLSSNANGKFILNKATKCIHLLDCWHIKQMLETNKQLTNDPIEKLESQGYWPCGTCLKAEKKIYEENEEFIDNIETNKFREILAQTLEYEDWGDKLKNIKSILKGGASDKTQTDSASKNILLGTFPFNCIVTIRLNIYLHISFKLEASIHYEHITNNQYILGVRAAIGEFKLYSSKSAQSKSDELTLIGKIGVEVGVRLEVAVSTPAGSITVALYGEIGVYADLSGIAHVYEKKDYANDNSVVAAYAAAYFEFGFYFDMGVRYNAFGLIKGEHSLFGKPIKTPIIKLGHDKAIYGYVYDNEEVLLPIGNEKYEFSLEELGLLEVKNIKLPSMQEGTETLDLSNPNYIVNISLEGGTWLYLDGNIVKVKKGVPIGTRFEGTLYMSITGKNRKWAKYDKNSPAVYLPTIEVKLIGETTCTEHSLVYISTIKPTCTSNGLDECSMCTKCHKLFNMQGEGIVNRKILPKLQHEYSQIEAVEPTCFVEGATAGTKCNHCGAYGVEPQVIDALGHDLNSDNWKVISNPTCYHQGVMGNSCSRCNTIFEYNLTLPNGHSVDPENNVPSCTKSVVCLNCAETLAAALEHRYKLIKVESPTCTDKGANIYQCQDCGDEYRIEIAPTGHSGYKNANLDDPDTSITFSCTEDTMAQYRCANDGCGKIIYETVKAIGHSFNENYTVDKAPTCTEIGYKSRHCERSWCSATTTKVEILALGHLDDESNPGETFDCVREGCNEKGIWRIHTDLHTVILVDGILPTCSAEGRTTGIKCEMCAKLIDGWEIIPKDPNNHNEEKIVLIPAKTPTCDAHGYNEHTQCIDCNKKFGYVELPARHTLNHIDSVEKTCTDNGNIEYWNCTVCDKKFSNAEGIGNPLYRDDIVIPAGHNLDVDNVKSQPCSFDKENNIYKAGHHAYKQCKDCDYKELILQTGEASDEQIEHRLTIIPITPNNSDWCNNWIKLHFVCNSSQDCVFEDIDLDIDFIEKYYASSEEFRAYIDIADNVEIKNNFCNHYLPSTYTVKNDKVPVCKGCKKQLGLSYEFQEDLNGYIVNGILKSDNKLDILPTYMGIPVVGIKDATFKDNTDIQVVNLPNSIVFIGNEAFSGCTSLTACIIESNSLLESIGNMAFANCPNLTSISLGKSDSCNLNSIGESLVYIDNVNNSTRQIVIRFNGTVKQWREVSKAKNWDDNSARMKVVCIDGELVKIKDADGIWQWNDSQEFLIEQNSESEITILGLNPNGFYMQDMNRGEDVIIEIPSYINGKQVVAIGKHSSENTASLVFSALPHIKGVIIPETVSYIAKSAFYKLEGLKTVKIYNTSNRMIELEAAFAECANITEISVSAEMLAKVLSTLDKSAITSLEINAGISIPGGVLTELTNLDYISIANTVTSIEKNAFNGLSKLKSVNIFDLESWLNITFENTWSNPLYYAKKLYLNGENITDLIIPEGITEIKAYAFAGGNFDKVYISNVINIIGRDAFTASNITKGVYISDFTNWLNITFASQYSNPLYYGHNLYLNGEKIIDLIIPDEITAIKSYAFAGANFDKVYISDVIVNIGADAFISASIRSGIYISNLKKWLNISFASENSNPLRYGLYLYLNGEKLTDLVIPQEIFNIKNYAFVGGKFDSVNLNNNIRMIGMGAFCRVTTPSIVVPSGVSDINDLTFSEAYIDSIVLSEGVKNIAQNAFSMCYAKNISVPSSVTLIKMGTFESCRTLEEISLPFVGETYEKSQQSVSRSVWGYYTGDNTTKFGYIFGDNYNVPYSLRKVTILSGNILCNAFENCRAIQTIILDRGVKELESGAFYNCVSLTTLGIYGSIYCARKDTFETCLALSRVEIQDLGAWLRSEWGGTKTIIDDNPHNPTYYSKKLYLNNQLVTSAIVPEGLTMIDWSAFDSLSDLEIVYLPTSITKLEKWAFSNCTLLTNICYAGTTAQWSVIEKSVKWDSNTGNYTVYCSDGKISKSGASSNYIFTCELIDDGSGYAITGISDQNVSALNIPISYNGLPIKEIASNAFELNNNIQYVKLPDTITTIGDKAFFKCTNLKHIILSKRIKIIGDSAFEGCENLLSIEIPNSVSSIGDAAFYGCVKFTNVIIPDSVTSIGIRAFANCNRLDTVTIGEGVASIGDYAFEYCQNLKNIVIPNSVVSIGNGAFSFCYNLIHITIGVGVKSIGALAFTNNVREINYSGTMAQWNDILLNESWIGDSYYYYTVYCTDGNLRFSSEREQV